MPGSIVVMGEDREVRIPAGITDLDSFHAWDCSPDYPQEVRISWLNGVVWMDLEPEQIFTHNQVRGEFLTALWRISDETDSGRLFTLGARLSNRRANFATEPDFVYVSFGAQLSRRVRLIPDGRGDYCRIEGSPEMVLEVVSDSSAERDTETLRHLYWKASISEFWLVDVRGDAVIFDILRYGAKGYVRTRPQAGGWLRSQVFGKSFRLTRGADRLGNPEFSLTTRD